MKPLVEKLPLSQNTSFVARTYRTPHFEVPWHQHIEYELILFIEGEGTAFIGNYIGEFKTDDVFFLGSNLPHTFQKAHKDLVTAAVVVQFTDDFWGPGFMQLPESKSILKLFAIASQGLKIRGASRQQLKTLLIELEHLEGFARIIRLCECLQVIAAAHEYETVSTQEVKTFQAKNKDRIDRIYQFTIDNFQEPIALCDVASTAGMSIPAFCSYFKKSTKKTYVDFLNEVRIGHACKLLIDTQKTVLEISIESGFNTLANFNKQFLKLKQLTPSGFRKKFRIQEQEEYLQDEFRTLNA
ncbi:AraC family transcriptional regulator [Longitalea luteola]|uniref:AraC family transcriptional regulator n=1 Tax=Longitalea luteola TaxID=2812563 RepID=UPI001A96F819|nr:AraC family transcriptional regulator [Longitalea luteola]